MEIPRSRPPQQALRISRALGVACILTIALLQEHDLLIPERHWRTTNTFGNIHELRSTLPVPQLISFTGKSRMFLSEAEEEQNRVIALELEHTENPDSKPVTLTTILPRPIYADELLKIPAPSKWEEGLLRTVASNLDRPPTNPDGWPNDPDYSDQIQIVAPFTQASLDDPTQIIDYLRISARLTHTFAQSAFANLPNSTA